MSLVLTQNAKMKRSSVDGFELFNFGIPAFKSKSGKFTCPNALNCVSGCYARSGTYNFSNVKNAYEARLDLTMSAQFVPTLNAEITLRQIKAKSKSLKLLIRIHDSGDFYSMAYAEDWIEIIEANPEVQFYAYTKMISLFEDLQDRNIRPKNFKTIYSYGGVEDYLIQPKRHYHAKVFESLEALNAANYIDGTHSDLIAALSPNKNIGLVYHGQKKYGKTNWDKPWSTKEVKIPTSYKAS